MNLFSNEKFAQFWNSISGKHGQTYKEYVLDPEMLRLAKSIKGKVILDLGCGNGYMGPTFIKKGAKKVFLADISIHNLQNARNLNASKKVEFVQLDATRRWKFKPKLFDLIYSDMMLNEVENIRTPIAEAYRTLKTGGMFVVAVTHPNWDLFEFATQKATGKSSTILKGVQNYFFRGFTKFLMGTDSLKPKSGEEYQNIFELEHYQRPFEDYFNQLTRVGFVVETVSEPPLNERILKDFPGYEALKDCPIGLVFVAKKTK